MTEVLAPESYTYQNENGVLTEVPISSNDKEMLHGYGQTCAVIGALAGCAIYHCLFSISLMITSLFELRKTGRMLGAFLPVGSSG